MTKRDRRTFLTESLLAAAAASAAGSCRSQPTEAAPVAPPRRPGPIRVAVVGLRGRGRAHVKAYQNSPDAEVVALVDVDPAVTEPARAAAPNARFYTDLRDALVNPDLDAVSIATPNHWHSLGALWALEAGKHAFVEKPISHTFHEGRVLAAAAAATGLVVQHGTQARSHAATRDAIAWLRSGALGAVKVARGLCYKRRASIGKVDGPVEPPSTCDYDLWTGPADLVPLRRTNLHYDWHWDFNTGNGDIGNQGVHQLDIARWGLGEEGFPKRVRSLGGRVGYDDDGNTPNTQVALLEYDSAPIVFEVRGLPTKDYRGATIGVVFECEEGYLVSAAYEHLVAYDLERNPIRTFDGGGNHVQNFLDAVKAGDPSLLNAESREGFVSAGLGHLANVSYHLGTTVEAGEAAAALGDDPVLAESLGRTLGHLAANELSPRTSLLVGADLAFDGTSFAGDRAFAAGALLDRANRRGFELPSLA